MDFENLQHIIEKYIEKFDEINNDKNREYYKWEAVKHFQDHFDINAPNFAAMFKNATKETYNLINDRSGQPTEAIVRLAERPELTETVRQMFKDLYADDGGDLDKRQKKIWGFINKCTELLDVHEKGKWKYKQEERDVMFYLVLQYPAQNYMYKATEVKKFLEAVNYVDDIGSGARFSLRKYYKFCDELLKKVKENQDLIALHKSRATQNMWMADDEHILVFEIIYCALTYGLYYNAPNKWKKEAGNKNKEKAQQERERQQIKDELTQIEEKRVAVTQKLAEYDGFSIKGLVVQHKTFGEGIVLDHQKNIAVIRFGDVEKKLAVPMSFEKGILKAEDEEAVAIMNELAKLEAETEGYDREKMILNARLDTVK